MAHDHREDIGALVATVAPRTIACIGPEAALFEGWAAAGHGTVDVLPPDAVLEMSDERVFDFAYVSGTLEVLGKRHGTALLARLRDIHSRRLAVLVNLGERPGQGTPWRENEMLALGLVRIRRYMERGAVGLYGFDLATYKHTPDWLNPKHWAHPELWDKYWW